MGAVAHENKCMRCGLGAVTTTGCQAFCCFLLGRQTIDSNCVCFFFPIASTRVQMEWPAIPKASGYEVQMSTSGRDWVTIAPSFGSTLLRKKGGSGFRIVGCENKNKIKFLLLLRARYPMYLLSEVLRCVARLKLGRHIPRAVGNDGYRIPSNSGVVFLCRRCCPEGGGGLRFLYPFCLAVVVCECPLPLPIILRQAISLALGLSFAHLRFVNRVGGLCAVSIPHAPCVGSDARR